jgi:hypothetical protein
VAVAEASKQMVVMVALAVVVDTLLDTQEVVVQQDKEAQEQQALHLAVEAVEAVEQV